MGWFDDIVKKSVLKIFEEYGKSTVLKTLDDVEAIKKINALIAFWMKNNPAPNPNPNPTPDPNPLPLTDLVIADLETIPTEMRAAGFQGRDTAVWYALFQSYAGLPWDTVNADAEVLTLYGQAQQIVDWFEKRLTTIEAQLKANPQLRAIPILHDGHDRGGFRLGPAIESRLASVKGQLLPWVEYKYV